MLNQIDYFKMRSRAHSIQQIANLLTIAAERDDFSVFEFLVEHAAVFPSDKYGPIAAMLQRRRDWINHTAALAHKWHVPLTAIRVIHEYVVGFNWSVVSKQLCIPRRV